MRKEMRVPSLTDPLPHSPIRHGDCLFSELASGEQITMLNIMPVFQNHLQFPSCLPNDLCSIKANEPESVRKLNEPESVRKLILT